VKSVVVSRALEIGTVYSGTLASPGEQHEFTFQGSAGQRLLYDGLDGDMDRINALLISPDGSLAGSANSDEDFGPLTLPASGLYRLVIGGSSDVLADYSFRIIDLAATPSLPAALNTVIHGTLSTNEAALYRFDAQAGQRLYFDAQGSDSLVFWSVFGVDGTYLGGGGAAADFELTMPRTGVCALLFNRTGPSTLPSEFQFQIVTPASLETSASLPFTAEFQVGPYGEERKISFAGVRGRQIYYDGQGEPNAVFSRILSPSGKVVQTDQNASSDSGPFTLLEDGIYRLILWNSGETTAPARGSILLESDATLVAANSLLTNTLSRGDETKLYRIETPAPGYHATLTNVSSGQLEANWTFYDPDNQLIAFGNLASDLGRFALTRPGRYLLAVQGNKTGTEPFGYSVGVKIDPSGGVGPTNFTAAGTVGSSPATMIIPLKAGAPYHFDSLLSVSAANVALKDGSGGLAQNFPSGLDVPFWRVAESGDYTLELSGNPGDAYSFRIRSFAEATLIGPGTNIVNQATVPNGAALYRFQGRAGERLVYDGLASAPFGRVQLFSPAGRALLGFCDSCGPPADSDTGPITLESDGEYYLMFSNETSDPMNFEFRLLDGDAAPTLDLNPGSSYGIGGDAQLDPRSAQLFRVTSPAGPLFFESMNPTDHVAYWTFYPLGLDEAVAGGGLNSPFETFTAFAGTHLLLLQNSENIAVPYAIRLRTPVTDTNTVTLGVDTSGTLVEPGRTRIFTFPLAAGQGLYYDALGLSNTQASATFYSPSGAVEMMTSANVDSSFGALESGIHQLWLLNPTGDPIDYRFRLLEFNSATLINLDVTNSISFNPGTAARILRFYGIAGMRLYGDALGASAPGSWMVYGPGGEPLTVTTLSVDFELTALPATGFYTLILNPESSAPFSAFFRLIAGNHAPLIAPVFNQTTPVGGLVTFKSTASDPELPISVLSYGLDAGPPGAAVTADGTFTWIPGIDRKSTTNEIRIRVSDDGIPPLSSTNRFFIIVNGFSAPVLSPVSIGAGGFTLRIDGEPGSPYEVQFSEDLRTWNFLLRTNPAALPLEVVDPEFAPRRFYRLESNP
jgi:hypothetical protein